MSLTLDAHQRHVVEADPGSSLLVLGEAGFGKTTAALHRLAHLARTAPFDRALVLVPAAGLQHKCAGLLRSLGVRARVEVLDAWLGAEARRAFPGLSERDSEHAPPGVLRFKRHPAVSVVLDEVAELQSAPVDRDDLFELWGDPRLLADVVDESSGDLSRGDASQVEEHTAVQFAEVDRFEDGSLMLAMGDVPFHDGTPLHDALTSDVEDYPVLFALDRLRGGRRAPRRFDHVVVDEAQEFAPLELALIGRAVRRGGSLTVVGDAGQQVDPTAWFADWEATLTALGHGDVRRLQMAQSHRCPQGVVQLARALRQRQPVGRPGTGVRQRRFDTHDSQVDALVAWARASPEARTTAVVTPDPEAARRWIRQLPSELGARLVLDRSAQVRGLVVTTVGRVRGLELDRVAVPDLSKEAWADNPSERNALYVAVTRATQEVWLSTASSDWSALLGSTQADRAPQVGASTLE
ncbi:MAG: AAA family ATPase [Myxococcales bacterium]|nr:AAA family ATPase [Myxococcales bacterium]